MKYKLPLIALLLTALNCHAAVTALTLVADTYIRGSSATSNFGNSTEVLVGSTTNDRMHGLLRFNFNPITTLLGPGETIDITSVQLVTTNASSGGNGTPTLAIYTYGFDFVESGTGGATWNSPATGDTTAGGTLGTLLKSQSVNRNANATNTFTSTTEFVTAVQAAFDGSNDLNLIMARNPDSSGSNNFTRFAQGGFDLQVTYDIVAIPEPSAALLGGLGMLALFRRRR